MLLVSLLCVGGAQSLLGNFGPEGHEQLQPQQLAAIFVGIMLLGLFLLFYAFSGGFEADTSAAAADS